MKKKLAIYDADIRQTVKLSVPIIIGQLGNILMAVFDNAMVGAIEPVEYGAKAVSAAGVSNAVYFLATVLGMGVMMAVSTLVSINKAKGDEKACAEYLKYAMVAAFIVTIVLSVAILAVLQNFHVFKQEEQVQQMAEQYLLIIMAGTFPLLAGFGVKNFADGLSYTKPAMVITLLGVVLNVFLNWIFIYGNLGAEAYGLNGAGYATVLSRIFIFVALLWYVYKSDLFKKYRVFSKGFRLSSPHLAEIFRIGLPSGLQYFFEVGAFAAANIMTGWISPFHSAAHQVALTLAAVSYMVSTGLSAAGAIRVGAAYGDNDRVGVRRAGITALVLVVGVMVVSALVFTALHNVLPGWFNKHPQVMEIASTLLLIAALFQLSDGVQCIGLGILRGVTDVKYPTVVTLFAYWVIGLPLAYVWAFHWNGGVEAIWYGLTIGLTVSAILLCRRFLRISRIAK